MTTNSTRYVRGFVAPAAAAQEELDARRRDAIAVLTHELRTPLHIVAASAELLLDGVPVELPAAARQHVAAILSAVSQLTRLTNDLLLQMRMAAGVERVEVVPVDVGSILEEMGETLLPLALRKHLWMTVSCETPGSILHTDPEKLRLVLTNLVANAIKFTDSGGVSVTGRLEGPDYVIAVSDTGPGIPTEEIPKLYDPFWRGGKQDKEGSGLGLAISKRLVELLGGKLSVDSTQGAGSTFTVRLVSLPAPFEILAA